MSDFSDYLLFIASILKKSLGQFLKKWLSFGTFCPPKSQNLKFGI